MSLSHQSVPLAERLGLVARGRLSRGGVYALLAAVVLSTYGLPCFLGLSWWPLPHDYVLPAGPLHAPGFPRYLPAVDSFSFPHADQPWRANAADMLRSGELPLWDPYSSLGVPLAAQYQNKVFFPPEWLEMFAGPAGWNIIFLVKLFLAGVGAYHVLARIFTDELPALIGAVAYLFSGFFLWLYPVAAFVNGAVLVPWLFWAVLNLADRARPPVRSAAGLAFVVGLMFLAGQPQVAVLSLASAGLFFLPLVFIGGSEPRGSGKLAVMRLGLFAATVVLGLAIAGLQVGMFWEAVQQGYTIHAPGAYGSAGTQVLNFTVPVWPYLLGQLMEPWDPRLYPFRVNWEAFPVVIGSFGLVFLALALAAALDPKHQSIRKVPAGVWGFLAVAVSILLVIVLGTVGINLWRLPVLNRVNLPRYSSPVLSFALAGLMAWAAGAAEGVNRRRLALTAVIVGTAAATVIRLAWHLASHVPPDTDRAYRAGSLVLGLAPFAFVGITLAIIAVAMVRQRTTGRRAQVAALLCLLGEAGFFVRYGLDIQHELARVGVLAAWCLAALLVAARLDRAAAVVVPVLVPAALLILGHASQRLASVTATRQAVPEHLCFLREHLGEHSAGGRVIGTNGVMTPNVGNAFQVAELPSLNPVQVGTTARFLFEVLAPRKWNYSVPNAWPGMVPGRTGIVPGQGYPLWPTPEWPSWADYVARRPFYNLLAVRYLVDFRDGWLGRNPVEGVTPVHLDPRLCIFEDHHAFPRAFAASTAVPVADASAARASLLSGTTDLRVSHFVECGSNGALPQWLIEGRKRPVEPLAITHLGGTRVDVAVGLDHPALVVLADAYYPGWAAYVDGRKQTLYRVDGALRGVLTEAGARQVSFRYEPPYLARYALLSGGTALLALALAVFGSGGRPPGRWLRFGTRTNCRADPATRSRHKDWLQTCPTGNDL